MNLDNYFVKNPKLNRIQMSNLVKQKEDEFIYNIDNQNFNTGLKIFNESVESNLPFFKEKNFLSFSFKDKMFFINSGNGSYLYDEEQHRDINNSKSHLCCGLRKITKTVLTKQGKLKQQLGDTNLIPNEDFIDVPTGEYEELFDFSKEGILKQFLSHFYCHIDNNENISIAECNSGNGHLNIPFTMQLLGNNHFIGGNLEIDKYGNFTIIYADNYFSTSKFKDNPISLKQHKKIIDILEKELNFKFVGNKEKPTVLTQNNSNKICIKNVAGPCSLYSVANANLLSDFRGLDLEKSKNKHIKPNNDEGFAKKLFENNFGQLNSKLDSYDLKFIEGQISKRDVVNAKNLKQVQQQTSNTIEHKSIKSQQDIIKSNKTIQNNGRVNNNVGKSINNNSQIQKQLSNNLNEVNKNFNNINKQPEIVFDKADGKFITNSTLIGDKIQECAFSERVGRNAMKEFEDCIMDYYNFTERNKQIDTKGQPIQILRDTNGNYTSFKEFIGNLIETVDGLEEVHKQKLNKALLRVKTKLITEGATLGKGEVAKIDKMFKSFGIREKQTGNMSLGK